MAVVNDRQDRPETMQPPNMHCEEFRGHFVVYKRHYGDDDECGLDEDLYVPMSREEVVVVCPCCPHERRVVYHDVPKLRRVVSGGVFVFYRLIVFFSLEDLFSLLPRYC